MNSEIIAEKIFNELPKSVWSGKTLSEIEESMQKVMKEISNKVLSNHVMPNRVNEIEDSEKKCECGKEYVIQKKS